MPRLFFGRGCGSASYLLGSVSAGIWTKRRAIFLLGLINGLIFFVPYLFGHVIIAGDNLNQNFPLRELVGASLRSGYLPLWNPFSWSGTPLLAGFNGGAAFPLTWLYAVLPANIAYLLEMALTFFLASTAVFYIAQEIGASVVAALLASLAFELTGQFVSQSVHLDMIQGIAFAIWTLFFGLRVLNSAEIPAALRYSVYMGVSFALVITAGAPEAMLDGLFMLGSFLLISTLDTEHRTRSIGLFAFAGVIAITLAAVQWYPGLAFQAQSNRASLGANFFEAGPWNPFFLPTFFLPFSLGNYGDLKVPNYIGSYNLAEMSSFVPTLVTLGALSTLLSKGFSSLRKNSKAALSFTLGVGLILALGPYLPPIEAVMAHVPLYNLQRLPSRNIFVVDLALVLLFAGSFDKLAGSTRRSLRLKLAVVVPVVVVVSVSLGYLAALVVDPNGLFHFLEALGSVGGSSYLSLVAITSLEVLAAVGASLIFLFWSRSPKRWLRNLSVAVLFLQAFDFGLQTLYGQVNGYGPFEDSPTFAAAMSSVPLGGRFAAFDPQLAYYSQLLSFGLPELNTLSRVPSVQGYSSLSIASYTSKTDTKVQLNLNPFQINTFDHNLLNLDEIFSGSSYFVSRVPSSKAAPTQILPSYQGKLPSPVYANGSGPVLSSFFLGSSMLVSFVSFSLPKSIPLSCLESVSGMGLNGKVSFPIRTVSHSEHSVTFQAAILVPTAYEISLQSCSKVPLISGAPDLTTYIGTPYDLLTANGVLSKIITPELWNFRQGAYRIGMFTSKHPVTRWLKAPSYVHVHSVTTSINGSLSAEISTPHPALVLRSEAFSQGWRATLTRRGQRPIEIPVFAKDTLQAIRLPKGNYLLRLSYQPSSTPKGAALSLMGVAIAGAGLILSIRLRRRAKLA